APNRVTHTRVISAARGSGFLLLTSASGWCPQPPQTCWDRRGAHTLLVTRVPSIEIEGAEQTRRTVTRSSDKDGTEPRSSVGIEMFPSRHARKYADPPESMGFLGLGPVGPKPGTQREGRASCPSPLRAVTALSGSDIDLLRPRCVYTAKRSASDLG